LNPQPETIYVVTPEPEQLAGLPITAVADDEVFKFNRRGNTPNWIFQQFVKLFQGITKNDLYLVVDSDLVFIKPFRVFSDNGKMFLWRYSYSGNTESAYRMVTEALGIKRVLPSMMSHFMMFDRTICRGILDEFARLHPVCEGKSLESCFYDWVVDMMSLPEDKFALSEWELYANFAVQKHRGRYELKEITGWDLPVYVPVTKNYAQGLIGQAISEIEKKVYKEIDVLTIHSRLARDSF
jgi:hypothetical protein